MGNRRAPSTPEGYIPAPESKTGRNRTWDRQHNYMVVTYRGIPKALHQEIAKIADHKGVSVGEVARAFLEYALDAFQEGSLQLNPRARSGKFTLFSNDRS